MHQVVMDSSSALSEDFGVKVLAVFAVLLCIQFAGGLAPSENPLLWFMSLPVLLPIGLIINGVPFGPLLGLIVVGVMALFVFYRQTFGPAAFMAAYGAMIWVLAA